MLIVSTGSVEVLVLDHNKRRTQTVLNKGMCEYCFILFAIAATDAQNSDC